MRRTLALLAAAALAGGCTVVVRPADPNATPPRPVEAPPPVVVAPVLAGIDGTPVLYVANWPEDVFAYGGRWYRTYRGSWYRAASAGGPWGAIPRGLVPRPVLEVPRDFRSRRPAVTQAPQPAQPGVVVQPAPAQQQAVQQQQTTVVVQQAPVQQTVIVQAPPPAPQAPAAPKPPPAAEPPRPGPPAAPPAPGRADLPAAPAELPRHAEVAPAPVVTRVEPQPPAGPAEPAGKPETPGRPEGKPEGGKRREGPGHQERHEPKGQPPAHAQAHGVRAKTPPPLGVTPSAAPIAGSPVAYAENAPEDLFLFEGVWYRAYEGVWYRAAAAGGEWAPVAKGDVPKAVLDVPADFRAKVKERGKKKS
jgi:hypothetical protein